MLHHTLGLPHELFYVRSVGHTVKALWDKKFKDFPILISFNGHTIWLTSSVCNKVGLEGCLILILLWEIHFPLCNGGLCHLQCGPLHNFACYAIHTFTHPRHSRLIDILQILELGEGNNGPKLRSRPSILVTPVNQGRVKHHNYFFSLIYVLSLSALSRWLDPAWPCHVSRGWPGWQETFLWWHNKIISDPASTNLTIHRVDHTSSLAPAWCSVNISELWTIWGLR